jgi:arginase
VADTTEHKNRERWLARTTLVVEGAALPTADSRRTLELIGAPSSAGAFSQGQEDAPAALREGGIVERLRAAGLDVTDAGDLPLQRWRPDRGSPSAQNVAEVAANAAGVRDRVAAARRHGRRALVIGGDCTTGVGTLAGVSATAERPPSWLYFDLHADLNTTTSVRDGALDWTGMAHALALPDTVSSLRQIGGSEPLLSPDRVMLFAHDSGEATSWEREQIERLGLRRIPCAAVANNPIGAAELALAQLDARAPITVHFDVDVINFTDAPLSESTRRDSGVPLETALTALKTLMADQRVAALTVTELNPQHAASDPEILPKFIAGLVDALAAVPEHVGSVHPGPLGG